MHSPVSSTTSCSRQRRLNPGDRLACPTEKTSVCAGKRIEPGRLHRFACKGGYRRNFAVRERYGERQISTLLSRLARGLGTAAFGGNDLT